MTRDDFQEINTIVELTNVNNVQPWTISSESQTRHLVGRSETLSAWTASDLSLHPIEHAV